MRFGGIDEGLADTSTLAVVLGRVAIALNLVCGDAVEVDYLRIYPCISIDGFARRRHLEYQTFRTGEVDGVTHPVVDVPHHVDTAGANTVADGEQLLAAFDAEGEMLHRAGSR